MYVGLLLLVAVCVIVALGLGIWFGWWGDLGCPPCSPPPVDTVLPLPLPLPLWNKDFRNAGSHEIVRMELPSADVDLARRHCYQMAAERNQSQPVCGVNFFARAYEEDVDIGPDDDQLSLMRHEHPCRVFNCDDDANNQIEASTQGSESLFTSPELSYWSTLYRNSGFEAKVEKISRSSLGDTVEEARRKCVLQAQLLAERFSVCGVTFYPSAWTGINDSSLSDYPCEIYYDCGPDELPVPSQHGSEALFFGPPLEFKR